MSQLFAVVVYSSSPDGDPAQGQRAHDHVFITSDPKPHLARLEEMFGQALNASSSLGRVLYSLESWEPSKEQKALGFNWNYMAKVVAQVSNQRDV